jgi:hypothetical protein
MQELTRGTPEGSLRDIDDLLVRMGKLTAIVGQFVEKLHAPASDNTG